MTYVKTETIITYSISNYSTYPKCLWYKFRMGKCKGWGFWKHT